ncbi:suppressor of tumorigenicity 14 protein homolog [Gigantopelta aegis]|uniref:suppressor of tumorigenicity 14 protein homolog n=1 Tax=Gigantopelta aegis TaxID=1735272 RepID=UPI001B888745|nr:suppressor of tumorigenicity 14 protein homolog [Gigantopelta aegis]
MAANDREPITLTLTNMTSQTRQVKYCILEVTSDPGHLLTLQIFYVPHNRSSVNCSRDYVHVGNDEQTIDKDTMTSYKYCERTLEEEVVSRDNYLWVVFRMSVTPTLLKLKVKAQEPVKCNSSHFRCSPVQCVSRSRVCDGKIDCRNARDEYCQTKASSLEDTTPCFRCKDGTCINPQLQRYHANWGVKLWYLCDGYSHCPDGTDERKDICFRLKGRLNSVFRCVPKDLKFGPKTSVLMWNTILCNNRKECFQGEDERVKKCFKKREKRRRLKEMRPEIRNVPSVRTELRNAEPHELIGLNNGENDFDAFGIRQTTV